MWNRVGSIRILGERSMRCVPRVHLKNTRKLSAATLAHILECHESGTSRFQSTKELPHMTHFTQLSHLTLLGFALTFYACAADTDTGSNTSDIRRVDTSDFGEDLTITGEQRIVNSEVNAAAMCEDSMKVLESNRVPNPSFEILTSDSNLETCWGDAEVWNVDVIKYSCVRGAESQVRKFHQTRDLNLYGGRGRVSVSTDQGVTGGLFMETELNNVAATPLRPGDTVQVKSRIALSDATYNNAESYKNPLVNEMEVAISLGTASGYFVEVSRATFYDENNFEYGSAKSFKDLSARLVVPNDPRIDAEGLTRVRVGLVNEGDIPAVTRTEQTSWDFLVDHVQVHRVVCRTAPTRPTTRTSF